MLINRENIADPYPAYSALRADEPVHWDETLNAWIVLDHDLIVAAFKDPRFSSDRVKMARKRFDNPALAPLLDTLSLLMLQRDEPDHTRLRTLVHYAFKRAAVETYGPHIRDLVHTLLKEPLARGTIDFVSEFAVPLPIMVISEIVGIPKEDRARVKIWCDAFSIAALNFYAHISEDELQAGMTAIEEFRQYLAGKIDTLRVSPSNDLLTALVQAEEEGERLSLDELVANVLLLLNAGNETTTCLLANGMLALLRNPDEMQRLRANPALIPIAIEELLRYDSPVQFIGRIAAENAKIGDQPVNEGALVLFMLGAAGRDPETFSVPESLQLDRHPNHHLSFGTGHHICAGVQLARLEARVAFEEVLALTKDIALSSEKIEFGANVNLRCPVRLDLALTPSAALSGK